MKIKVKEFETIVDPLGQLLLTKYKFYWSAGHDGKSYLQSRYGYLHRMLMKARRGEIVDHINRDTRDNRLENLRLVSYETSNKNRGINKNNTSGVKYVSYSKQRSKWRVYGFKDFKQVHLGVFKDLDDACQALEAAKVKFPDLFDS